jgi:hypothetical protein
MHFREKICKIAVKNVKDSQAWEVLAKSTNLSKEKNASIRIGAGQ